MNSDSPQPIVSVPCQGLTGAFRDYQLIRSTANSRIYIVQDGTRRLILKALPEDCKGDYARRKYFLEREFKLLEQLDSPFIARVWKMVEDPEVGCCLVMEYVEGCSLGNWLDSHPSKEARRRVLDELMDVLEYLHHKQVVHADLKPDNILVSANGNHVKLIDFGLSDKDELVVRGLGATPSYSAPEQRETGTDLDCRADIYALGHIIRFLFPHRYRRVASVCLRERAEVRFQTVEAVRRAIVCHDNHWKYYSITAIAILLGLLLYTWFYRPLPTYSGKCSDSIAWELHDSVLTISGSGPMVDYETSGQAPWYNYRNRVGQVRIEENVTTVGDFSFSTYPKLTSVQLSSTVIGLGNDAFSFCASLTSVELPAHLDYIRSAAFASTPLHHISFPTADTLEGNILMNDLYLEELLIPEGIAAFPEGMVYGCLRLRSLDLPSTMQTIGHDFLHHCRVLERVTCRATVPPSIDPWASLRFISLDIPVYVPTESLDAYRAAPVWCMFTNFQPIEN